VISLPVNALTQKVICLAATCAPETDISREFTGPIREKRAKSLPQFREIDASSIRIKIQYKIR